MDRLLVEKIKRMTPGEIGALPVKLFNPLVVVVNLVEYIKELERKLDETQPTQPDSVPGVSDDSAK